MRSLYGAVRIGLSTIPLFMLLPTPACKAKRGEVSLSKRDVDASLALPAVKEGGPRLFALKPAVIIREKPAADAAVIGELRAGASVGRSVESIVTGDCPGGYYAVAPRGFVCHESRTSLDHGLTLRGPELDKALPYRFGRAASQTPIYQRIPSSEEQLAAEPDLDKHMTRAAKDETRALRVGANDVALDERSVAHGPPVLRKDGQGVEEGTRTKRTFFAFGQETPLGMTSDQLIGAPVASVLRRQGGVALASSVVADGPRGPRTFGVTPGGQYVPIDRLDPSLGSTFHGVDLAEKGLPIAFTLKHETSPYSVGGGKAERIEDEELERRSVLFLSGKYREVDGERFEETDDGNFFRARDVIKVVKRSKFPDFVTAETRWIDVSLALQTLTLYEGKKPVYATLISSGQAQLGDPQTEPATQQGTFKILKKSIGLSLDPRETAEAFEVFDAPYALEFSPGFAIIGSYHADTAGEARNFHNVTVTPIDARRIFTWAGGEVPAGWQSVVPRDEEQIVIHVRK